MAEGTKKRVAQNKRARHDYFIEDTLEAGLVLTGTEVLSRYRAYIPNNNKENEDVPDDGLVSVEDFQKWQSQISITVKDGVVAVGEKNAIAVYDESTQKAYYEQLINF